MPRVISEIASLNHVLAVLRNWGRPTELLYIAAMRFEAYLL